MPANKRSPFPWRLMRVMRPWVMFWAGRLPLLAGILLVLETTGRVSGRPRRTPLQYEWIDGVYFLGAARGVRSDWYRNLQKHAEVRIRIGRTWIACKAAPLNQLEDKIAFLQTRLERHPRMVARMLRYHGATAAIQPGDLLRAAEEIAVVSVTPVQSGE